MVIHWIEKMKYKQNIKHKTQTYNIFWKKEKPNKTQTELAWKLLSIVTNQHTAWKELFQISIMCNYKNITSSCKF